MDVFFILGLLFCTAVTMCISLPTVEAALARVFGITPSFGLEIAILFVSALLAMGGLEVAKIFGNFSGALMALPSLLLTACWLKIIREDGKDLLHTYRAKD